MHCTAASSTRCAMRSARMTCAIRHRSTRAPRHEHAPQPGDRQQLGGLGAGRAGRRRRPHRTVRQPGRGWHHAVVRQHRDGPRTPVDSAVRAGEAACGRLPLRRAGNRTDAAGHRAVPRAGLRWRSEWCAGRAGWHRPAVVP
ncbi:hypothetical protein G6F40_015870 [Rhizopus arrhizus]|nr:hypothetical protein G6F40_015870 [Rhizopus arrhizus]